MLQWREVLSDALASRRMVGVNRTISEHVGREPTRSELNAGRRAANTMADKGEAVLVKVVAVPAPGRRPREMIVLARTGVDVSDPDVVAAAVNGQGRSGRAAGPAADPAKVVPGLINTLRATAATARLLDVTRVGQAEAVRMEAALTESLSELTTLRNRFRRRVRGG